MKSHTTAGYETRCAALRILPWHWQIYNNIVTEVLPQRLAYLSIFHRER